MTTTLTGRTSTTCNGCKSAKHHLSSIDVDLRRTVRQAYRGKDITARLESLKAKKAVQVAWLEAHLNEMKCN
jgi:hypothetical protein